MGEYPSNTSPERAGGFPVGSVGGAPIDAPSDGEADEEEMWPDKYEKGDELSSAAGGAGSVSEGVASRSPWSAVAGAVVGASAVAGAIDDPMRDSKEIGSAGRVSAEDAISTAG